MIKVSILGAGNIGHAIAHILANKPRVQVEIWDKNRAISPSQKGLSEVVSRAQFLFLCMPSYAIPAALRDVVQDLNRNTVVVNLAKGIEVKSGLTVDALLKDLLPPRQPFVLLSGPMLAGDLVGDEKGWATAASHSDAAAKKVGQLFKGTGLTTHASNDPRGVAVAGALKNVYSVLLGAADGMGLGWNAKGILAASALLEMQVVIPKLGGKKGTEVSPAGLADLVATGFSPSSRNHQVGVYLATGASRELESEGLTSSQLLLRSLGKEKSKAPLLSITATLAKDPENGKKALKKFLAK